MSTFFTAAIVIAATIALTWLLIAFNRKNSRNRTTALLRTFNRSGAVRGLSFSSQEVLKDHIIGIDGIQQQLLVFNFTGMAVFTEIVLAEVRECTVARTFEKVNYGSAKKPECEQELQSISLHFSFKQNAKGISIPFYNSRVNSIYEKAVLEAKAQHWQLLLSKMLQQPSEVRA